MMKRHLIPVMILGVFLLLLVGSVIFPVSTKAVALSGPIFINSSNFNNGTINCVNNNCTLTADIEAPYTAIFIVVPNITLDLAGHTITYDTAGDRTGVMGINFFRYRNAGVALGSDNAYSQLDSGGNGINPTIKNGKIIVGSAGGSWSTSVGSPYDTGIVTAYNLQVEANGQDASCIASYYGEYVVHDVYCVDHSTTTGNRHQGPAAFRLPLKLTAYNNIIIGGNSAITPGRGSVIYNNFLRHNSFATNGYGVWIYGNGGSWNMQVYNNIIAPSNGRGILINGDNINSGVVAYDNVITAHDTPNAEYGEQLNATCVRIRYSTTGTEVRNNKCLAIGGGNNTAASAISLTTATGMVNYVHDNDFRALLTSPVGQFTYANGISLEGTGINSGYSKDRIENNSISSNNYILRLDGYDGGAKQEMIEGNTFQWIDGNGTAAWYNQAIDDSKYNYSYPVSNTYVTTALLNQLKQTTKTEISSLISGESNNRSRATFFTNYTSYSYTSIHGSILGSGVGFEPSDVAIWAADRGVININIGDAVTVQAQNSGGSNLSNQTLTLSDNTGTIQTVQTDSSGKARLYPISYVLSKPQIGATVTKTMRTNQQVTVSGFPALSLPLGLTNTDSNPYMLTFGSGIVTDTVAPVAITTLAASNPTASSLQLTWTAPGDDGSVGTATSYDLRYSTSAITAGNFSSASQVTGEPTPSIAGTSESMAVSGLSAGMTYYFAIKTNDEVPNISSISNIVSAATTAVVAFDTTAPAAVANLVVTGSTSSSISLSWTAPGDDGSIGTVSQYDIRYAITEFGAAQFSTATQVNGEPVPTAAGTMQSMTISGLNAGTTYYFVMVSADEVPNTSLPSGIIVGTTASAPVVDVTAPAAITNLSVSPISSDSAILNWTAPGDDGSVGTATSYDLRYSVTPITSGNFNSTSAVTGEPAPTLAGTNQSLTVSGLTAGTTYYFAIKSTDEVLNVSLISNIASGTTTATIITPPPVGGGGGGGDITAPGGVTDLRAVGSGSGTVTLTWIATGDDGRMGTAYVYDLRYSNQTIDSSNFDRATSASGEPIPSVAGVSQSMTINNLTPNKPYYFALRAADEVLNWSVLSNVVTIIPEGGVLPDVNVPAPVTTISITSTSAGVVTLKWIEPQSASSIIGYDVRYSPRAITDSNFSQASKAQNIPRPVAFDTSQKVTIRGLIPWKKYYFTIKAVGAKDSSVLGRTVCTPRRLSISLLLGQATPDYCQVYSPYPRVSR